ncbi:ABC transporter permease subunit [Arachnia propionica]|nr:ABC transporter permease subunit [Arachnia propionica]RPA18637.1 ABC transporter permease subunit [Arachnia propionica]
MRCRCARNAWLRWCEVSISARIWGGIALLMVLVTVAAPWLAPAIGDSAATTAFAYSTGGPGGLGHDYLGRPVLPQLLEGGRALLVAALLTAVVSQGVGLAAGLWLATRARGAWFVRFVLDVVLVTPMIVASLVVYQRAGASLYATIPIATALTLPFTSRYYRAAAEPLLGAAFFEQARVAGDRTSVALVREVVPVLLRPVLADLGLATITALYLMATISFLGTTAAESGFLWPTMVSRNLDGLGLNPWAVLAPLGAMVALTVPVNLFVDALGGRRD